MNLVKKIDDQHFEVAVRSAPVDGKANEMLIVLVAKHFGIAKSRVKLVSGLKSKNKVIEI